MINKAVFVVTVAVFVYWLIWFTGLQHQVGAAVSSGLFWLIISGMVSFILYMTLKSDLPRPNRVVVYGLLLLGLLTVMTITVRDVAAYLYKPSTDVDEIMNTSWHESLLIYLRAVFDFSYPASIVAGVYYLAATLKNRVL